MFTKITEKIDRMNSKEIQKWKFMVYICETMVEESGWKFKIRYLICENFVG